MAIKLIKANKQHRSKMYACFAFFPDGSVKRWKYVTDLASFTQFLNKSHSAWKYFNVYEKGSKLFVKRFYPGNLVPKTLAFVLLFALGLLTQKFTFSKTFSSFALALNPYPLKNTFSKTTCAQTTFMAVCSNGFNNSATIPTLEGGAKAC